VLPNDSDECSAYAGVTTSTANIGYFMSRFGNHRELLDNDDANDDQVMKKDENENEEAETEDEEEVVAVSRDLKGSKGGSYKSYYYYGGKGKGKGKGKVRFMSDVIFSCA
jgi:hypothetical protein